jgi:hypothetical protein
MINNLSNRVYTLLSDKPLLGIISGTASGLLSHEFIGMVGTYAGALVAVFSALVWSARVYDTYKPRCIKMYIKFKPRIIRMKNLFFLVIVIMAMCMFGCKTRHVLKSETKDKLQSDSTVQQSSAVKTSHHTQVSDTDTSKVYKKTKTTVTATFHAPLPGSAAPGKTSGKSYNEKELQAFITNYLASLSITNETEDFEQKGSSKTSSGSITSDSTGTKEIKAGKLKQTTNFNKNISSKPDYGWIKYVAIILFLAFVAWSVYYRVTHPRLGTIANFVKSKTHNG